MTIVGTERGEPPSKGDMQRFALGLLLLATTSTLTAADPTDWPQGRRMVVTDDGPIHSPDALPTFASASTLWLMRIGADATPHCEAWTTRPSVDRKGEMFHGATEMAYYSSGPRLDVCAFQATATELAGGDLDVSGMRWFASEKACTTAIAHKDKVATDLRQCLPDAVAQPDRDAARNRFIAIAKTGGNVYDVHDGACRASKLAADAHAALPAGTLVDGDGARPYLFRPTDDVLEITDAGDVEETQVAWGADEVEWNGTEHWLSESACKMAIQLDAKRAAWLPPR